MKVTRTSSLMFSTLLLLGAVLGIFGVAEAGAGCHSTTVTEGSGSEVTMEKNCFTPSVLRVEPGTTVTWVNKDSIVHNLAGTGNSFGHFKDIGPGDRVSYKFDKPGTFSYQCYIHPGMGGTIVVGDGVLAGAPQISTAEPPKAETIKTAETASTESSGRVPVYFAVALLVIGGGLGFAIAKLKSAPPKAQAELATGT